MHQQLRAKVLFIIVILLAVIHIGFEWNEVGDFLIYYQASHDVVSFKDIYALGYGEGHVLPYYGSPVLALIMYPFTLLSFALAAALWKLLSLFFLYRIYIRIESFIDVSVFSKRQYITFLVGSFLAVCFVVYRNFHLAQFTIFILFACIEGYWLIETKRKFAGAFLLALGIICKVLPIVMLPYLIYRRYFMAAGWMLVLTVALIMAPALYFGLGGCLSLNAAWWHSINPSQDLNIFDVSTPDVHGLTSLISTLFIKGIGINEETLSLKRNILDLAPHTVVVIIQTVRIAFATFTLYFLRTLPFVREANKQKRLWEIGYILMVTPLIFPQQRLYAFFFLFPAIVYLNYRFGIYLSERRKQGSKLPLVFYLYGFALVVFNLELLLGAFREYYWHFKTVTYACLIILVIYAWRVPQKGKEIIKQ